MALRDQGTLESLDHTSQSGGTRSSLNNRIDKLLFHRLQFQALADGRSNAQIHQSTADIEFLRGAANESLRLHQPVPALLRIAARDTALECNGRAFRQGERIALFFSAASELVELSVIRTRAI